MEPPLTLSLKDLIFDNRFIDKLPADPVIKNYRRQVKNACFSYVEPTLVTAPSIVALSREMFEELNLDINNIDEEEFLQVFVGNLLLPGMKPYAMCYGGHQFGNWAGQLGDGRAINLGEVINANDMRWCLQLKGAGPTPYSRTADGLAVLRSSLREFLCSEAMFHLGVPTTRALSLVLTGEKVRRDMFYDGHPEHELGAVVCRVAPSFIRFGNFQILSAQNDIENLRKLVDYTIETDFPHLELTGEDIYLKWFEDVCLKTADMILHWMRVGFVHGVMNTDNMSILGLTIDYGPYGWLEDYDPGWTPNTTDANGRRYRFSNQSQIALWNLLQLAEAIYPLINDTQPLEKILQYYNDYYQQQWNEMMANKLGFETSSKPLEKLNDQLLNLLQTTETDMTIFYRCLSEIKLNEVNLMDEALLHKVFDPAWYQTDQLDETYFSQLKSWLQDYAKCAEEISLADHIRKDRMNKVNPKYVLRNYLAQQAIDKADLGDYSMIDELLDVLRKPYDEQPDFEIYAAKRPEWARHSMLSCSS